MKQIRLFCKKNLVPQWYLKLMCGEKIILCQVMPLFASNEGKSFSNNICELSELKSTYL